MTYASHIADLVGTHITNRDPRQYIVPLLSALGCRHLAEDDQGDWGPVSPPQPPYADEPVVTNALLLALAGHMRLVDSKRSALTIEDEGVAILDGLSKNNRWVACVADTNLAYDLVSVLMLGPEQGVKNSVGRLASEVRPAAVDLLNAWIAPAVGFDVMPSSREVAEVFFDSAWCVLALDNEGLSDEAVVGAIRADRPPFRCGLVAELPVETVSLPSLEVEP